MQHTCIALFPTTTATIHARGVNCLQSLAHYLIAANECHFPSLFERGKRSVIASINKLFQTIPADYVSGQREKGASICISIICWCCCTHSGRPCRASGRRFLSLCLNKKDTEIVLIKACSLSFCFVSLVAGTCGGMWYVQTITLVLFHVAVVQPFEHLCGQLMYG